MGSQAPKKLRRDLREYLEARPEIPFDEFKREAYAENPPEFAAELCRRYQERYREPSPLVLKLLQFERMQSAGCPIGRHELTDEEWVALAIVKDELQVFQMKRAQAKGPRHG